MKNKQTESAAAVRRYLANFEEFESRLNGDAGSDLHSVRRDAIRKFVDLGFPTTRDEDWKYTNLGPLLAHPFGQAAAAGSSVSKDTIGPFLFKSTQANTLVFVNGRFRKDLSNVTLDQAGLVISDLASAARKHPELLKSHLGKFARCDDETFVALNTGFLLDGTVICVPDNVVVEQPIHILHVTEAQGSPVAAHPRLLVVLGKSSELRVIETFHGADSVYFNNSVGEFVVGQNAHLDHVKLQDEAARAFHISQAQFHQARDSYLSTVNVDLGGRLTRNAINVSLDGENCETHLHGFYMGRDKQHIDNHTFIDHAKPRCFSNELFKGILDEQSHGVFNGKILVRQDAQKTNALQSNKTLLLTDDAAIDAKPQLEIFADDVKCTHGATIGQLDDEALFYLRARGIGEEMAGALLRHAFVTDVLESIKDEEVRRRLDAKIIERFTSGD